MSLESVLTEKSVIAKMSDEINSFQYFAEIKRCNLDSMEKYKVSFSLNNESVGYINFIHSTKPYEEFVFTGFYVKPEFRGQNLSNGFLEFLFQYAERNKSEFSSTTTQRKPLPIHILMKHGFEPVETKAKNQVYIIGQSEEKTKICFRNEVKEREFLGSRLMEHSGQYIVQSNIPTNSAPPIFLRTEYVMTDLPMLKETRTKVSGQFTFQFLI
ncbi:MAG: GNAT family N-acetyltransferase [Nanoarchaeota archaeon]|nr:GNAT family N-acetyltransferase [Nanoarchaeota archaeon]